MLMGRPISEQGQKVEILMEIEATALEGVANEALDQATRKTFARIAEMAYFSQSLNTGIRTGEHWFREHLEYMLGGYRAGETGHTELG